MRRRRFLLSATLVAVAALAPTGCGDDDGSSTTTTAPAATEDGTPTTAPPGTVEAATTTEASPTDGELDEAAITEVVTIFFDGSADVDARVAVLENGERYRDMLADAALDERAQAMAADIREIRAGDDAECAELGVSSPCAVVTHDLTVAGAPMLVGQESAVVLVDGEWKVSAAAWCAVVEIGGASCPA